MINGDSAIREVGRYRSTLNELLSILQETFRSSYCVGYNCEALYSTIFAPVICRVKILAVDSLPYVDYSGDTSQTPFYYQATTRIIDTLKGVSGIRTDTVPLTSLASNTPAIVLKFDYTTTTYDWSHITEGVRGISVDTSFISNDHLSLVPGDEVVVFLSYQSPRVDAHSDYFRLSVNRDYATGLLRIDSQNRVHDINHTWSAATVTNYEAWVVLYNNLVSSILNCE